MTTTIPTRYSPGMRFLLEQGLALIDLAAVLRTSTGAVSHWLTGKRRPPVELFHAVAVLRGEEAAGRLREILEEAQPA